MTFAETVQLLRDTGNEPHILEGAKPAQKVLVAPSLVGRVMGTTVSGEQGRILGWINSPAIERGPTDPVWNNYGGEERLWFAPEGGQFGLFFGDRKWRLENHVIPAPLHLQPYEVVDRGDSWIRIRSTVSLSNRVGTQFRVEVTRRIALLETCPFSLGWGDRVRCVGFEAKSRTTNLADAPIARDTGMLGMWCLAQLPSNGRRVVILPLTGSLAQGTRIREEFGKDLCVTGRLPSEQFAFRERFAMFRADGRFMAKVGVGRNFATNRLGSVDLDSLELVVNHFDCYPEMDYVASYWREMSPQELYDGDVLQTYLDGPATEGGPPGQFYELEVLSPALPLHPRESFTFRNRIYHLFGDRDAIGGICQRFLGPSLEELEAFRGAAEGA